MESRIYIGVIVNHDFSIKELLDTLEQLDYNLENICLAFYVKPKHEDIGMICDFQREYIDVYDNIYIKCFKTQIPFDYYGILDAQSERVDYYLRWENGYQITRPSFIEDLIEEPGDIIAPMISVSGKLWSNFWGAIDEHGYYQRSEDYVSIVERDMIGSFVVPYITGIYLISLNNIARKLKDTEEEAETGEEGKGTAEAEAGEEGEASEGKGAEEGEASEVGKGGIEKWYISESMDTDMYFCKQVREAGIDMRVNNTHYYGYIRDHMNGDEMGILGYHEYYDQWKDKYINRNAQLVSKCTDVWTYPIFNRNFGREMIELIRERRSRVIQQPFGKGIDLAELPDPSVNDLWSSICKEFIWPRVRELYNYSSKEIIKSYVIKETELSKWDQEFRHDDSTYTVNVELSGSDQYEGGGYFFERQNYYHDHIPEGCVTIYPGRLTHYYTRLPITSGHRYVLVSLVM